MNSRIDIPNWYQVDFDISHPKKTLEDISKLMDELNKLKLVDKWFYLFEGKTIRVRMHSLKPANLQQAVNDNAQKLNLTISTQQQLDGYWETTDAFEDVNVVETFAEMMSSLTALTIQRLKGKKFSNYRFVERISHCIFNNVYGTPTEEYFLLKRLVERFGGNLDNLNDNPEQTVLDEEQKYAMANSSSLSLPSTRVPQK